VSLNLKHRLSAFFKGDMCKQALKLICQRFFNFFKIKFCIYFFSINQFFLNFLDIYFLAQSTMEKKVILKMYLLKGVGMVKIRLKMK
jgi:hypothetical protein